MVILIIVVGIVTIFLFNATFTDPVNILILLQNLHKYNFLFFKLLTIFHHIELFIIISYLTISFVVLSSFTMLELFCSLLLSSTSTWFLTLDLVVLSLFSLIL